VVSGRVHTQGLEQSCDRSQTSGWESAWNIRVSPYRLSERCNMYMTVQSTSYQDEIVRKYTVRLVSAIKLTLPKQISEICSIDGVLNVYIVYENFCTMGTCKDRCRDLAGDSYQGRQGSDYTCVAINPPRPPPPPRHPGIRPLVARNRGPLHPHIVAVHPSTCGMLVTFRWEACQH
jgi:hypothetical protein